VSKLQAQGVDFLACAIHLLRRPRTALRQIDEPVNELANLGILVDRDDEG